MCVQIPEKQDLFDLFSLGYRDTSLITSSLIVLKMMTFLNLRLDYHLRRDVPILFIEKLCFLK